MDSKVLELEAKLELLNIELHKKNEQVMQLMHDFSRWSEFHKYKSKNEKELPMVVGAVCISCECRFDVEDIVEWLDCDSCPVCPKCGIDCVLPVLNDYSTGKFGKPKDISYFPTYDDEFISEMNKRWFGVPK